MHSFPKALLLILVMFPCSACSVEFIENIYKNNMFWPSVAPTILVFGMFIGKFKDAYETKKQIRVIDTVVDNKTQALHEKIDKLGCEVGELKTKQIQLIEINQRLNEAVGLIATNQLPNLDSRLSTNIETTAKLVSTVENLNTAVEIVTRKTIPEMELRITEDFKKEFIQINNRINELHSVKGIENIRREWEENKKLINNAHKMAKNAEQTSSEAKIAAQQALRKISSFRKNPIFSFVNTNQLIPSSYNIPANLVSGKINSPNIEQIDD